MFSLRRTKNTPWDKNAPHAALTRLLDQAGTQGVPEIPREGHALVPGCGKVSRCFHCMLMSADGSPASLGIRCSSIRQAGLGRDRSGREPHCGRASERVGHSRLLRIDR